MRASDWAWEWLQDSCMGSLGVALWSVVGSLFIELAGYCWGMLMEGLLEG